MSDESETTSGHGRQQVRRVHGRPEHQMTPEQAVKHIQSVFRSIREKYAAEGERFEEEDAHELINNKRPETPPFPIFIFLCAAFADFTKIFLDFLVVTIPVAMIIGIMTSFMLFFWMWGKVKGMWYKKMILGWAWKRFIITAFAESFPILNIFPGATIFVLMAHFRETKVVRLMNAALDAIHEGGVMELLQSK
jgi:hypothetical protein